MTDLVILALNDPRWVSLIQTQPEATIFHHPIWGRLLAGVYGYHSFALVQIDGEGKAKAGVPLIEVSSWLTGRRYISLPFSDHCAPLTWNSAGFSKLTTSLLAWWETANQPRLEIRSKLPAGPHIYHQQAGVLHQLDLSSPPTKLFANFSKMHQRNTKRAEKSGVQVEIDTSREGIEKFYRLHLITRRRLGVPIQPHRYFQLLWEKVIASGLGFVLLAYIHQQVIAGAVFLGWNRGLTYKYGASDLAFSSLRANNLLFWSAIQWGCQHDYHQLDFGRTDFEDQGLRDFKSGWGATETPLIYSYLGGVSPNHASGWKKQMLSKVIRFSPSIVCRILGELLYGHFA